ncbi:S-layer homology domain-containing protein [Pseudobacteroides cellulosolvens]|uniref:S-layer domain-containing protein n=1 Tax=Pseudobacteroides cellulosolvens ATCC 35603 = DSM 2933 TaxID=398512 RepID=A0A0L6JIW8_9FIRM|nr:S-layer homology domain-containing protein [Pseudobacteroides cellulosolvens]KNY25392.1 S-layer domain-containing protein [Pseudobacteroides cellulosolvens ATCC 35603 = DSM 2933]
MIHLGGEPIAIFNAKENIKNTIKGSSVYIAARELNVNGNIRAGADAQQLIVDDEIKAQIKRYEDSNIVTTSYEDCPLYNSASNIKAFWDPVSKKIVVDDINASGGNVFLSGQIMSTIKNTNGDSSGAIEALDGFSNINIVNNSNYAIEFNDIKVGQDFEGKIRVTDTAPMVYNSKNISEPVTKEYTRVNGKVFERVVNDGNGNQLSEKEVTNANFTPLSGLRYTWVTGERSVIKEDITYCSSSFWGIDWLSKDPDDIISYEKIKLDKVPLLEGEYVEYRPAVTEHYKSEESPKDFPTTTLKEREITHTCNWSEEYPWYKFKSNKYYAHEIYETGIKDIKRNSIEADAPIKIGFIGFEDHGTFSIDSKAGEISFNKGFGNDSTDIKIDAAKISSAPAVVLWAKGVTLSSKSGIGDAANPLCIETKNGEAINISSSKGNVYLLKDNGNLILDSVKVPDGDLVIVADGDIASKDIESIIETKGIDFTSRNGKITGINLSSSTNPIMANALEDIDINVLKGNAIIGNIDSLKGAVKIIVTKGSLISKESTSPALALLDYKKDKLILDTGYNSSWIKAGEITIEAQNVGNTPTITVNKNSLSGQILNALEDNPDVKYLVQKTLVQNYPLSEKDIKKEFIKLFDEEDKTDMTKYLIDKINEIPNKVNISKDEQFAQILNSIVFFDCNKFYEDVKGFLDEKSLTDEIKGLINNSARTEIESQKLNRLILEISYPKEIVKSVPVEIEETYVELPYINDINIEAGKLNIKSGHDEFSVDQDGNTNSKYVPGNIYVEGKEEISLGTITGDNVVITFDKGIKAAESGTAGITAKNVFLTVNGNGSIGNTKEPLEIYADKISGKTQGVIAITTKDIDDDVTTKENINVGYIYGLDTVSLISSGSITAAYTDMGYNIESRNPNLKWAVDLDKDENSVKVYKIPLPVTNIESFYVKGTDNGLKSLEIFGEDNTVIPLSPQFSPSNLEYTAKVSSKTENITVKIEKDEHAVAEISGNRGLKVGRNIVTVVITAENGYKRTYTIEVTRDKATEPIKEEDKKDIPSVKLTDISKHWANEAILNLLEKGIVSGYTDNTFKPDNKITRAEVAVLLIKVKGIVPGTSKGLDFKDWNKVPSWAAGYLMEAVNKKIMGGYPDKTIGAEREITRAEAIVMILKAFEKEPSDYKLAGFKDSAKLPKWASGYISTAFGLGFIKGYADGTIKPNNRITRAEVAWIIFKAMESAKAPK